MRRGEIMETCDTRDFTKEPPANLDPRWVLSMQRRLKAYRDTGSLDWYEASVKGYEAYLDSMADDDHPDLVEYREVSIWLRNVKCQN